MLILIHFLSLIRLPQISPIYRFDHPSDDLRVLQVSINLKDFLKEKNLNPWLLLPCYYELSQTWKCV